MENQGIDKLINQYFKGQLPDEDYGRLSEMLKDKQNLQLFDQAKIQWGENPEETPLSKRNWIKVQTGIHQYDKTIKPLFVSRKIFIRVASVAALFVFAFLIGGIAGHYFFNRSPFSQDLVFETPRGEKSVVTLPDGSQVWLNASSKLVCKSFNSRSRNVELAAGEAFFKVARNEKSPFRVKTSGCDVEVLGTEFNIMAYENFGRQEITLLSGKVEVEMKSVKKILSPGEALIIKDDKNWITKTNARQSSAWIENKFDFQNIPLSELVKRLENWYDIDIELVNQKNREVNFTGTFKNEETVWEILEAIQTYMPMKYKKTDSRKLQIIVE